MRDLFKRLEAWLRREAYVREVVEECTKNAYLDGHKEGLATGQSQGFELGQVEGRRIGYEIGLAHGELMGRDKLAAEIQIAHGIGGGEREMTQGELATLKVRQLH